MSIVVEKTILSVQSSDNIECGYWQISLHCSSMNARKLKKARYDASMNRRET
jgi:hypothetical protein